MCAHSGSAALGRIFRGQRDRAHELESLPAAPPGQNGKPGRSLDRGAARTADRLIGLILLLSTVVNVVTPTLVDSSPCEWAATIWWPPRDRAHLRAAHLLRGRTENLRRPPSERLATPAAYVYTLLLAVLYPVVWATICWRMACCARWEPAPTGLHVPEQRGAAHRARRGRRHDPAATPANAHEHSGSGKRHGRGHHGAARGDRRHRHGGFLDKILEQLARAAHPPAGVRGRHRSHHRCPAHEARGHELPAAGWTTATWSRRPARAKCTSFPRARRSTRSC